MMRPNGNRFPFGRTTRMFTELVALRRPRWRDTQHRNDMILPHR